MKFFSKLKDSAFYWDLFFLSSILGIWPRFIEPKILSISRIQLPIPEFSGLKALQISDLHFNAAISKSFLKKISFSVKKEKPDLIFLTGDFICRSQLQNKEDLKNFLLSLDSTYGNFAVLGNHDYSHYVSINKAGDYDIFDKKNSQMSRGFKRFFKTITLTTNTAERAKNLKPHEELTNLLKDCGIRLLENSAQLVKIKGREFNIIGLGEHMLSQANPEKAFYHYDRNKPGIILVHNPDAIPKLSAYPGNLILSGHTHGGQINLPWIWNKLCILENPQYKRGLFNEKGKWIYVSRGVGGSTPFRFLSIPEITVFTLG